MKAAELRPWTHPTLRTLEISDHLLLVTLCGELTLKIKLICGNAINDYCYEICCRIFFLRFTCEFVDGSCMFECFVVYIYGPFLIPPFILSAIST